MLFDDTVATLCRGHFFEGRYGWVRVQGSHGLTFGGMLGVAIKSPHCHSFALIRSPGSCCGPSIEKHILRPVSCVYVVWVP